MCVLGVLWAYLFLMCVHASAQPKAKLTDSFPLWSPLVPLIDRHNAKVQALSLVPMLISFSCIFMSSLGFNQLNKGWDRWLGAALITDWLIRKRLRTSYNNHRFLNVTFLHHLCFLELMSIKLFFCRGKEISNLFSWCGNCKKKKKGGKSAYLFGQNYSPHVVLLRLNPLQEQNESFIFLPTDELCYSVMGWKPFLRFGYQTPSGPLRIALINEKMS